MTVKELIEELKKLPQDGDVYYEDRNERIFNGFKISIIEIAETDKDGDTILR